MPFDNPSDPVGRLEQRVGLVESRQEQADQRDITIAKALADIRADVREGSAATRMTLTELSHDQKRLTERIDAIGLNGHAKDIRALVAAAPSIIEVAHALKPLLPTLVADAQRQQQNENFWHTLRLRVGWDKGPGKALRAVLLAFVGASAYWLVNAAHAIHLGGH